MRLGAETIEALDGSRVVATHARLSAKGTESLVLDHYLEVLRFKPGALPGATALVRARASGAFSADHEEFWRTARRRLGDADGTRALIEVLLAHRSLPADAVRAGIRAALGIGSGDPATVGVGARRGPEDHDAPGVPIGAPARHDDVMTQRVAGDSPAIARYAQLVEFG